MLEISQKGHMSHRCSYEWKMHGKINMIWVPKVTCVLNRKATNLKGPKTIWVPKPT